MSLITELKITGGRGSKITIVFDDLSTLEISKEALEESDISTGLAVSPQQIQELKQRDHYFSCLNAALRFMTHRPRSKREVAIRLRQRGFSGKTIETVLKKLEEKKLLDDAEFAKVWTDNRKAFSPRSKFAIRHELMQKGISSDMIDEAIAELNDDENAYQAGLKKIHLLKSVPHEEFIKKLARLLQTKGFSFSVTKNAVERLWQKSQNVEKDK